MATRTITSGVIYTNGSLILIGHATGTSHWDIPKGRLNDNETPKQAVVRETKEETGLTIDSDKLIDLGLMPYIHTKDLYLWKYIVDILPDISTIKCESMFINKYGKLVPEMNKFKYATLDESLNFVSKSMAKILKNIRL